MRYNQRAYIDTLTNEYESAFAEEYADDVRDGSAHWYVPLDRQTIIRTTLAELAYAPTAEQIAAEDKEIAAAHKRHQERRAYMIENAATPEIAQWLREHTK